MTRMRQARPWCVCLLVTTVSASANGPFQASCPSSNEAVQRRYPNAPSLLFWRGGASQQSNRPPPPPPPRRQNGQQHTNQNEQQDFKRTIPPPPRRQRPLSETRSSFLPEHEQSVSHSSSTEQHQRNEAYRSIPPPRPHPSKPRPVATNVGPPRPPPPRPPHMSTPTKPEQKQEAQGTLSFKSTAASEAVRIDDKPTLFNNGSMTALTYSVPDASVAQDVASSVTRKSLKASTSSAAAVTIEPPDESSESITSPTMFDSIQDSSIHVGNDSTPAPTRSLPPVSSTNDSSSVTNARDTTNENDDSKAHVLFLVPPKEELNRISLQTALSGGRPKQRQEELFSNWIQLGQHNLALEELLQSQQDVKENVRVITQLLQELVAQRPSQHDSLVVHVPRQVARHRRRVEKVRMIPRKTILSSLQELDRDLSEGEFDALIQGLQDPSEVEEVYYEYEYDDDDEEEPWLMDDRSSSALHTTPNVDEVNAFLRASSESESWYSGMDEVDPYDDMYSDEYYDVEPLDEDLLAAWSASDYVSVASSGSDELGAESSAVNPDTFPPIDESIRGKWKEEEASSNRVDSMVDYRRHLDKIRSENPFEDVRSHPVGSHSQRREPPPPPPLCRSATNQRKAHAHTRRKREPLRHPFPPPPPPNHSMKYNPVVHSNSGEYEVEESDVLDEDELQLLEETAVGVEEADNEGNFDEYDHDIIDEDDLRILQFSRWTPFSRKKTKRNDLVEANDLIVDDDDIFFDASDFEDGVATDDFTDFDVEEGGVEESIASLGDIIEESSSSEEMLLGDSAVMETVSRYGRNHLEQLPPPPPPRPPPRPPVEVGPSAAAGYSDDRRQLDPSLQRVSRVQHAHGVVQYPVGQQPSHNVPPVQASAFGHQDEGTGYPNRYSYPN